MRLILREGAKTAGLSATKLCMQSGGCSEKPSKKKITKK